MEVIIFPILLLLLYIGIPVWVCYLVWVKVLKPIFDQIIEELRRIRELLERDKAP